MHNAPSLSSLSNSSALDAKSSRRQSLASTDPNHTGHATHKRRQVGACHPCSPPIIGRGATPPTHVTLSFMGREGRGPPLLWQNVCPCHCSDSRMPQGIGRATPPALPTDTAKARSGSCSALYRGQGGAERPSYRGVGRDGRPEVRPEGRSGPVPAGLIAGVGAGTVAEAETVARGRLKPKHDDRGAGWSLLLPPAGAELSSSRVSSTEPQIPPSGASLGTFLEGGGVLGRPYRGDAPAADELRTPANNSQQQKAARRRGNPPPNNTPVNGGAGAANNSNSQH